MISISIIVYCRMRKLSSIKIKKKSDIRCQCFAYELLLESSDLKRWIYVYFYANFYKRRLEGYPQVFLYSSRIEVIQLSNFPWSSLRLIKNFIINSSFILVSFIDIYSFELAICNYLLKLLFSSSSVAAVALLFSYSSTFCSKVLIFYSCSKLTFLHFSHSIFILFSYPSCNFELLST